MSQPHYFAKDFMNNLKYFYLSIFLIGLFLIIPQICRANLVVGFLSYNIPLMIIVAFMGIWIIEALVIKNRLTGTPQKALFIALVVNIITVAFSFFIGILVKTSLDRFSELFLLFLLFLLSFFASILIEGIILYHFYPQEKRIKVYGVSSLMNLQSYLFLVILFISDMFIIGSIFLTALLVPYFFLNSFKLLTARKEISKSTQKKVIILIILLSLIVFGVICKGAIKGIEHKSERSRVLARDARRQFDMHQLYESQKKYYLDHGKYFVVPGCISGINCYPNAINNYLFSTPKDPLNKEPYVYKGINNEKDNQKFCYYAKLERKQDNCLFYVASHQGVFCKKEEPILLENCGETSEKRERKSLDK
jgi:hypothetical protein